MITERVKHLADLEGITIADLERRIGASQGTINKAINKKSDLSSKWLSQIMDCFPSYSAKWLLTGKLPIKEAQEEQKINLISTHSNFQGEVLIGASKVEGGQHTDTSYLLIALETLTAQIKEKDLQISNLISLLANK